MPPKSLSVESFDFAPGRMISGKYVVEGCLGSGIEGEVYRVREARTGLQRALKVYFPQVKKIDSVIARNARILDKLRKCPIVIQYHHAETLVFRKTKIPFLVSEYVDGVILSKFMAAFPRKRIPPFEALHIIYEIAKGLQTIHALREYHGDLHSDNILISRRGLLFDVKVVDFFDRGKATQSEQKNDIIDLIALLHEIMGGRKHYRHHPQYIKDICRGLRRDLILKRFPNTQRLVKHLESFEWS